MKANIVEDENGDLLLEIPDGVIEEIGWQIGDTLIWEETYICGDGHHNDCVGFTLRKKEDVSNNAD